MKSSYLQSINYGEIIKTAYEFLMDFLYPSLLSQ